MTLADDASTAWPEYGEGYWERGEGSNYVDYADDPGWGPTVAVIAEFAPTLIEAPFARGPRLLEVACAKGYFVKAAMQHGYDAEGIDLSRWAIDHADPMVRSRVQCGNAVDLPWPDDWFEVVCSWEFLEHVPEEHLDRVIREMIRVAKPGALFVHRIGTLDSEDDRHDHMHDHTHVTNHPREWWASRLREYGMTHRPPVEEKFDRVFSGRDWARRYFAYEVR